MATLAISAEMLNDMRSLERRAHRRVNELVGQFAQLSARELRDLKGINLERHKNQRDPRARTVRIDDNHRAIVLDAGDDETYVLVRIGTHDQAERWMHDTEFGVNRATGAFEILDVAAINAAADGAAMGAAGGTGGGPFGGAGGGAAVLRDPDAEHLAEPLYRHRRDRDFTGLGVAAELVPVLRVLTDEEQLQGLIGVLPQAQAEALILLTGDAEVSEIYAEVAGDINPDSIDPGDIVAALNAPASLDTVHVFTDEHELMQMLDKPMERWRVYLHHSQRDAAYRPTYSGPARVTGGPGTGKTVVALHRAKALAEAISAAAGDLAGRPPGTPVLFTTFTRNLAQQLERDLRTLGGTDLADLVDVVNVDRLAYRIVADHEGAAPLVVDSGETIGCATEVLDDLGMDRTPSFLIQEWEQVVLAQNLRSRDEYLAASRSGRGIRLNRRERVEVWRAIEELERLLTQRGRRTYLQVAAAAAGYLRSRSVRPYRHVIVDEAQDLHETQWRMLRAAVDEAPNDLFIVGDSHQRIYDRRSSLAKVGIEIRGRSSRLRLNYRTTHEILAWSLHLLGDLSFDDLDVGTETSDVAGYHSFMHGTTPTCLGFRSRAAMADGLVSQVRSWLDQGVDPTEIGVTARSGVSVERAERALQDAGISTCVLGAERLPGPGVRLGTMHRCKGLEFRCVAVVDVDADQMPAVVSEGVDETQHRYDLARERCLFYVAATRAREDLWVGWVGRPSPFLGFDPQR